METIRKNSREGRDTRIDMGSNWYFNSCRIRYSYSSDGDLKCDLLVGQSVV